MDNVVTIIVAIFGSVGLWQLIIYFVNRRANQRKAVAEADREVAMALAAAAGVPKAKFEADSVAVTNSKEIMAQAIQFLRLYQEEVTAAKEEKQKLVEENRKLQTQIRHLEVEVQQMSRRFGAMELVVIDIAAGVKRLSEQLKENGMQPIWKSTVTLEHLDSVLSDAAKEDVKKLFQ